MGSRTQGNYGGSGKPLTRKLWAISKRDTTITREDIQPLSEIAFTTREDVDEYLSGETIECLICGKKCKKLGVHLVKAHDVDPYRYKRALGLPTTKGLAAKDVKEKHASATKILHKNGGMVVGSNFHQKGNRGAAHHPPYWYKEQAQKFQKALEKQKDSRNE